MAEHNSDSKSTLGLIYRDMCYITSTPSNLIMLDSVEIKPNEFTINFVSESVPTVLNRFLRFWKEIFESQNIRASKTSSSLSIQASSDKVLEIIQLKKKEYEQILKKEHEITEEFNKKLAHPENKQQQISNDEKLARLLQWQEFNKDIKRDEFLSDDESIEMQENLENQYLKFKR